MRIPGELLSDVMAGEWGERMNMDHMDDMDQMDVMDLAEAFVPLAEDKRPLPVSSSTLWERMGARVLGYWFGLGEAGEDDAAVVGAVLEFFDKAGEAVGHF